MRLNRLDIFIEKYSHKCEDNREFNEFMWDLNSVVRQVSETSSILTLQREDQARAAVRDRMAWWKNVFFFVLGGIVGWLVL